MTRIEKLLIALRNLITHPKESLDALIDYEEEYRKAAAARFGVFELPTVDLLDLFPDFSVTVDDYSFLEGTSLPTDIGLLKLLCARWSSCHYLEIGSWRGESLANVADVASECVSITLSTDEMQSLGLPEAFIAAHGTFSDDVKNVRTIEHDSLTFDFSSLHERFDLVFIDADHSYPAVKSDTENVLPLLRDERSVIVWHDYGLTPDRVRHEVLVAILDAVPKEKHASLYHVSNTLCAVLINGMTKATTFPGVHPRPNKAFSVSLGARRLPDRAPA